VSIVGFLAALLALYSDGSEYALTVYKVLGWQIGCVIFLNLFLIAFVFQQLEDRERIANRAIALEADKSKLELEIDNLRDFLIDDSIWKNYDPLVGLPNLEAFRRQITRCIHRTKRESTRYKHENSKADSYFQIVFIRLSDFEREQDISGLNLADKVRQKYARLTHQNMRRNEYMFSLAELTKCQLDTIDTHSPNQPGRIGKNDFGFILQGDWYEALGFVKRHIREARDISEIVSNDIDASISVDFYAGICPVYSDDSENTIIRRLKDTYAKASSKNYPIKAYWYELLTHYRSHPEEQEEETLKEELTIESIKHMVVSLLEKDFERIRRFPRKAISENYLKRVEEKLATRINEIDEMLASIKK